MTQTVNPDTIQQLNYLRDSLSTKLEQMKKQAEKDIVIDEIELDRALLDTPKLHAKYLSMYSDEGILLKDYYGLKEKAKLERWKYWMGKQSDNYYHANGIPHEKVLKTDLDKYLAADEKLCAINEIINIQKALVEYLERIVKEITNRGFHVKSIIDWRKFTNGQ